MEFKHFLIFYFMALLSWLGDLLEPIVDGIGDFANSIVESITGSGLGDSVGDLLTKATGQEKLLDAQQQFTQSERIASQEYNTSERLSSQAWQQNMWQEQQRNGAALQIQGMVDAGINPNTAVASLGGGSAVPSSTNSGAPSGEVVGAPSPAPLGSLFEILPQMMKVKSESNLANALASKAREETKTVVIDNQTRLVANQTAIDEARGRIGLMETQGKLNAETANQIRTMLPLMENKTLAEIDLMYGQLDSIHQQIDESNARIAQISQAIEESKAIIGKLNAEEYEAYMSGAQSSKAVQLYGKQMSLYDAEKELDEAKKVGYQLQNGWAVKCHEFGVDPQSNMVANAAMLWTTNKSLVIEAVNGAPESANQSRVGQAVGELIGTVDKFQPSPDGKTLNVRPAKKPNFRKLLLGF